MVQAAPVHTCISNLIGILNSGEGSLPGVQTPDNIIFIDTQKPRHQTKVTTRGDDCQTTNEVSPQGSQEHSLRPREKLGDPEGPRHKAIGWRGVN